MAWTLSPAPAGHTDPMRIPQTIVCVDCGGVCHLISYAEPDEGFRPGDIVAYRCEDCLDRWDMELDIDDDIDRAE